MGCVICSVGSTEEFFYSLNHCRIFRSIPNWSHPLIHHDACMAIDEDPQEEQDNRRDYHHSQRVQLVVLRKAWAVKVKAGVELDADQSQDDANSIRDGLRVGLEVLQDQLQTLHDSKMSSELWVGKKMISSYKGINRLKHHLRTKQIPYLMMNKVCESGHSVHR